MAKERVKQHFSHKRILEATMLLSRSSRNIDLLQKLIYIFCKFFIVQRCNLCHHNPNNKKVILQYVAVKLLSFFSSKSKQSGEKIDKSELIPCPPRCKLTVALIQSCISL